MAARRHPFYPKLVKLWLKFELISEEPDGFSETAIHEVAEELFALHTDKSLPEPPLPIGETKTMIVESLRDLAYPDRVHWRDSEKFAGRFYPRTTEFGTTGVDADWDHILTQIDRSERADLGEEERARALEGAKRAWRHKFGADGERTPYVEESDGSRRVSAAGGRVNGTVFNAIARELEMPVATERTAVAAAGPQFTEEAP